jgi:Zn-dependent protease
MPTEVLLPQLPAPIHNCPTCQHWLADGVLACPECNGLTYGRYLNQMAQAAQVLERERRWPEARDLWQQALVYLPEGAEQTGSVRTHLDEIDKRIRLKVDERAKWKKRLGPLAPIFVALAKFKTVLLLAFKFKFLFSFLGFFALYWGLFGWKFALGFTLSILIHEMGHYAEVKRRGLQADLPVFLPGLGAYVRWYHEGIPLDGLAMIALAGPLFGLVAAVAALGLYFWIGAPVLMAIARTGAYINLLNLIPVLGLDGAQATYALNRTQRLLLVVSCAALFAMMHEGIFVFIGLGMLWRCFTKDLPEAASTRTLIGYLALLFVLGAFLYLVPNQGIGF